MSEKKAGYPMSPRLSLTLHGGFDAKAPSGPVGKIGRRGQALLAFLALAPRQRATRAAVMTLLWGDRGEEQARASLRQELSTLRRVLPDGTLDADRNEVWLEDTVIDQAAEGELLAGFDLGSEPFEDWLREARSASRPQAPAGHTGGRGRPSLAILPFAELGVPDADMFAEGIVEEITGALGRVHDFHVIARQSAYALKGSEYDIAEASQRLGAEYLVEGSVRRAGDRIRIAVQLVRGKDGHLLWSERFDDRMDDLFDLQDRIAAKVAGQISPNLRMAEITRARSTPPADRSAYELVLSAMPHFWAHQRDDNAMAMALLDKALEADPGYPLALALKAWTLAQQSTYLWVDWGADTRHAAMELAEMAARDAGDHVLTLVAIGAAISMTSDDIDRASFFIDRALTIDPNCAWGWMRRGFIHVFSDEPDPALAAFDRAISLSPLDPYLQNMVIGQGIAKFRAREFADAARLIEKGMSLGPGGQWAYRALISIYDNLGRKEDSARAAREFFAANPRVTIRHIKDSLPPTFVRGGHFPEYFDGLRKAGVPEE